MANQIMSATGVKQSDTAATVSSFMERDANGDAAVRDISASRAVRSAGSVFFGNTAKTAGFTADTGATTYTVDTTSGSATCVLPAAATCTGQHYIFKKTVAANSLIIDGSASETIDGATTKTATAQYACIHVYSDGSVWHIVAMVGAWS